MCDGVAKGLLRAPAAPSVLHSNPTYTHISGHKDKANEVKIIKTGYIYLSRIRPYGASVIKITMEFNRKKCDEVMQMSCSNIKGSDRKVTPISVVLILFFNVNKNVYKHHRLEFFILLSCQLYNILHYIRFI